MTHHRDPSEDDTEPSVSRSGSFRLQPTTPEEGALSPSSQGAWRLALLFAAFTVGLGFVGTVDGWRAAAIAKEVVAPVEKKIDDHMIAMQGKRESMDAYTRQQQEVIEAIRADAVETKKMIRALCRASARPAVCLGEN